MTSEISIGELIEKIAILDIRMARLPSLRPPPGMAEIGPPGKR